MSTEASDPAEIQAQLQQQLQAQEDEKIVKAFVEIYTKAFDRNAAYNNALLVAGYAGAFTVWSFTRSQVPDRATIAVALALVISLASFIAFEVVKMIVVSRYISKQAATLNTATDAAEKREVVKAIDQAHARVMVWFTGYWKGTLAISVGGALIAGGLLVYNFVAILLRWPCWPS